MSRARLETFHPPLEGHTFYASKAQEICSPIKINGQFRRLAVLQKKVLTEGRQLCILRNTKHYRTVPQNSQGGTNTGQRNENFILTK